jgi:response regulator RpfG family c-di-GMP phosphodiesterase
MTQEDTLIESAPSVDTDSLLIPLNMDQPSTEAVAEAEPVYRATILFVDDEANILRSLARLFRGRDLKILIAESGESGLKVLSEEQVDLVVSDMRMPNMDGAQFLTKVYEGWPDTERLLLTGYADITATVGAINQGRISRYIAKPWVDDEILGAVENALKLKQLKHEKQELEQQIESQNNELEQLNQTLERKVEQRTKEIHASNERLKSNYVTSIKVFSNLIELRGGALSGHSRRVGELAVKIGTEMKLPRPVLQEILLGSLLHDVGKIGFKDDILSKPLAQMNIEETNMHRSHTKNGQEALEALGDMEKVSLIVRSHHEMWDGSGYPDNLSGERIPLTARIVCVANDYDGLQAGTLTVTRLKPEAAAKMIQMGSGKRYDPVVVRAFERVVFGDEIKAHEHIVTASELKVDMVLSRDLFSSDGALLAVANTKLADEETVKRLQEYKNHDNSALKIVVKK